MLVNLFSTAISYVARWAASTVGYGPTPSWHELRFMQEVRRICKGYHAMPLRNRLIRRNHNRCCGFWCRRDERVKPWQPFSSVGTSF